MSPGGRDIKLNQVEFTNVGSPSRDSAFNAAVQRVRKASTFQTKQFGLLVG